MSSSCGKTCWTLQRTTECHKCRLLGPDFPWSQDTWQLVSHQCESKWHKSQKVIQEKGASWSNGRCTIYFPGEYFFWYLNDPAIEAPFLFARRQVVSPTNFGSTKGSNVVECMPSWTHLMHFEAALAWKTWLFRKWGYFTVAFCPLIFWFALAILGHCTHQLQRTADLRKRVGKSSTRALLHARHLVGRFQYIQSLSPIVNDSQHHEPTKSTRTLIFWTPRSTIVALVAQMPVCSVYSTSFLAAFESFSCIQRLVQNLDCLRGMHALADSASLGQTSDLELRVREENRPCWNLL